MDFEVTLASSGRRLLLHGRFHDPLSGQDQDRPTMTLVPFGTDEVLVTDGPEQASRGEFLRDPAGAIVWFRYPGRLHRRS